MQLSHGDRTWNSSLNGLAHKRTDPMSPFQELKLMLVENLHLAKDAIHIYIGFVCFMLAITVGRRSASSYQALVPGFIVAILLEVLDLRDDIRSLGYFRWGASLKDILNTNLIPLALVVAARLNVLRRDGG